MATCIQVPLIRFSRSAWCGSRAEGLPKSSKRASTATQCIRQGDYQEALSLFQKEKLLLLALPADELDLHELHYTSYCIAVAYPCLCRWEEAYAMGVEALDGLKSCLHASPDHQDLFLATQFLSDLCVSLSKYEEKRRLDTEIETNWNASVDIGHCIASIKDYYVYGDYRMALKTVDAALDVLRGGRENGRLYRQELSILRGCILEAQGEVEEAREEYQSAYKELGKKLGKDHPSTVFASIHMSKYQNYDTALETLQGARCISEERLGTDHENTLLAISQLAFLHGTQNEFDTQLELLGQVLDSRKKRLGEVHLFTLETMESIARVYSLQSSLVYPDSCRLKHYTSVTLSRQVQQGRKSVLGADHPLSLGSSKLMADCLAKFGTWVQAGFIYGADLPRLAKRLGADHPRIMECYDELIKTLCQYDLDVAEIRCQKLWTISEKSLGKDNEATVKLNLRLAHIAGLQGHYDRAISRCQDSITILSEKLGESHPKTLVAISTKAHILYDKTDYSQALELYRKVQIHYERLFGAENRKTLAVIQSIADVLYHQEEYDKALGWARKAGLCTTKLLGAGHTDTLRAVYRKAKILQRQGNFQGSLVLYRWVQIGYSKAFGTGKLETLGVAKRMADVLYRQEQYQEALLWVDKALDGIKLLGEEDPATLEAVYRKAEILSKQGKHRGALEFYTQAVDWAERTLGRDHPTKLKWSNRLADCYREVGRVPEPRRSFFGW